MKTSEAFDFSRGLLERSQGLNPMAHLGDSERLGASVENLLTKFLAAPASELMRRSSHQFRGRLVKLGYELAGGDATKGGANEDLERCARSIELLHLGSLIVDDVQDGSVMRRGGAALHAIVGVPQAIAVGNWLYFHASNLLAAIRSLDDSEHLNLIASFQYAVELAHLGQALDIGAKSDTLKNKGCMNVATMCARLKTGAIIMLALAMGGIIAGASGRQLAALKEAGFVLGLFLQRLNDLGNFLGAFDEEKRFEDVISLKPSFVWGFTEVRYGAEEWDHLKKAVDALPDHLLMDQWLARHPIRAEALAFAEVDYARGLAECGAFELLCPTGLERLNIIKEQIVDAYL